MAKLFYKTWSACSSVYLNVIQITLINGEKILMRDDGCEEFYNKQWRGCFPQDLETFSTCSEMTNLQVQLSAVDHCQLIHSEDQLDPNASGRVWSTSEPSGKGQTFFGCGTGKIKRICIYNSSIELVSIYNYNITRVSRFRHSFVM